MAEQRDNLNLSGQLDVRLSFVGDIFRGTTNCNGTQFRGGNFKNAVFEGPATFNGAKFHSGVDFTGAAFKDHADFENAEFYGGTVDFSGAVFLVGASFKKARFGNPSQRTFGQWDIRFSLNTSGDGLCSLEIKRVGEIKEKWTKATEFPFWSDPSFHTLLGTFEIKVIHDEIAKAFREFRNSPQSVSFSGCRFGEMNIDGFPEEKIKEVLTKERERVEREPEDTLNEEKQSLKLFEDHCEKNNPNLSELKKTTIMAILSKHLEPTSLRKECLYKENQGVTFTQTSFYPQRDVTFERTLFLTGGHVGFKSAIFGNRGDVNFDSSSFGNRGDVNFGFSNFGNGGDIGFRSANFVNSEIVNFGVATFGNGGDVGFYSTNFNNGEDVLFSSVSFDNCQTVWFDFANFSNGGSVLFASVHFNNGGSVRFNSANLNNGRGVNFESIAFCNGGYIGFDSATFSNGGNAWFDSVNFGNKGKTGLSKIVWINDGDLNFSKMGFRETLSLKFDECLFLCTGNISFKEARFPEKGSTMFQRCYFGRTPSVDFTGAVFRHTSFEGGEISWLTEKENLKPEQILKERLGEKTYDALPDKSHLDKGETLVFEKGTKVLWKDLTTESAKNLTLRRVNLSHSIFDGMTLSHIQLNAPEWFEKGKDKWWKIFKSERRILFEETTIEDAFNNGSNRENAENRRTYLNKLKNIGDQYTQLKNNLEKQGNYFDAGHFHYGEQEIRRKILKLEEGHRFHLFLSSFYKALSGYGERPRRALISTLTVIGLFSFILATLNINTNIGGLLSQEGLLEKGVAKLFKSCVELITPFSWSFSWKETATSWNDYWNKLDFIKGSRLFFLVGFQVFLFGIQLPLLVLAVRRRFKR